MAMSGVTFRNVIPNSNAMMYAVTYSKANASDTLNMATNTPIKTVYFASASTSTAGAEDPVTVSGATITFSAGSGAGYALVIGTC